VPRSGEEGVMIRRDDWAGTVLYAGKKLTFRMIHRPDGIYALRVDASADI
jgi:cold shock protein